MKKAKYMILVVGCVFLMTGCANLQHIFENPNNRVVEVEEVVPQDRAVVDLHDNKAEFMPEGVEHGAVIGDWAIESVNGKPVKGEYPPYLKFSQANKTVYGNNGCNVVNAGYKYNASDSTLVFSNVITTARSCAQTDLTDYEINAALNNTRYYTWHSDGSRYYLELLDAGHKQLMQLMHQNFDFLNGTWCVDEIGGEVTADDKMQLVFDVDEMKLHGNTGCNILNGTLNTDLETANSISFQQIVTTRMACPDTSDETALLVALEEVMYINPLPDGKAELLDSRNRVVLRLTRVNLTE